MKNTVLAIVAAIAALVPAGCNSSADASRHEPPVLAVRNMTGARLAEVSVRGARSDQMSQRVGSISPVPAGVEQVFVRPARHPSLPAQVEISWTDAYNVQQTQVISLEQIHKTSTGAADEVLVVIIDGHGARAVLEHTTDNPLSN